METVYVLDEEYAGFIGVYSDVENAIKAAKNWAVNEFEKEELKETPWGYLLDLGENSGRFDIIKNTIDNFNV